LAMFSAARLVARSLRGNRFMATGLRGKRLVYKENGKPSSVLQLEDYSVPLEVPPDSVLVRMLAAPINPSDLNQVEGVYPIKPDLPAVGGNEGVGEVALVGSNVTDLEPLDRVIPASSGMGTWCSAFHAKADDLIQVPADIPVELSATMAVNPCTAYRMLRDFVVLEEGDTIIQNGSNSAVGQAAVQMAKAMGVNSVCLVRDRDDFEETASWLEGLGATLVLSESEIRTPAGREKVASLPPAKLALNCVGGKACVSLLRNLGQGGTMVTYGGMSKQPVMVPTGLLIFNDVRCSGFWMTRWNQEATKEERQEMLADISLMIRYGQLSLSYETHTLLGYEDALEAAQAAFTSKKQIFLFS